MMKTEIVPFSMKDTPALIEHLLPVQKLSAESFKEQEGRQSKTLTPLGSYWKGRKPLILNKACVLGCLLPVTDKPTRDLEIFEMLMAMDNESFAVRIPGLEKPKNILAQLTIPKIRDFFEVVPDNSLPESSPINWTNPEFKRAKVDWRTDISSLDRRRLAARMIPTGPYRDRVYESKRPEQIGASVHDHIWPQVNQHLGTSASSIPQLIEQLGLMRFGRRPVVSDFFCGSGQIPFEAARLGCDVVASDLNPMACMLTWGALNIVGAPQEDRSALETKQSKLVEKIREEIDQLEIESDGNGWRAKVFLYCVEARCPETGYMVPLLPTFIISKGYSIIAELSPDKESRTYKINIRPAASPEELSNAERGSVRTDGKGQDPYLVHSIDGREYRTKISTLRGDYRTPEGENKNKLRMWDKGDIIPKSEDLFQERLYAIQWVRAQPDAKQLEQEFRSITIEDLERERTVQKFVRANLPQWQEQGVVPDMKIEPGAKTDEPIRTRGWTHWHHLFNPRQLLLAALANKYSDARMKFGFTQALNLSSRLSRFDNSEGGAAATKGVFDNQALNTLFNYGARGSIFLAPALNQNYPSFPLSREGKFTIENNPAAENTSGSDIFITDPPYGDAVKYEEILEFFIAWFRKNPPPEFSGWTWDSRRALAIKGEDEDFRKGMVTAYARMAELMSDNGLHVVMFTHQSGSIWADMANIVWASGLCVTAAWYVVTETDSALREGSHVKGTVLLVLRKRTGALRITRDDLAWEIKEEVEKQVLDLTGLNQAVRTSRDENVFEDADLQMAGYAAALRAITRYSVIDGRDMPSEAIRPRVPGEATFVDDLIEFAVATANRSLVPSGISKSHWEKLGPADRFYLKMIDLESRGAKTLDNYQNFAKAFKVRDFLPVMASRRANDARLKSATELGRVEMSEGSEFYQSLLRATLYALMEIVREVDGDSVIQHLSFNVKDYLTSAQPREMVIVLSDYLSSKLEGIRPEEASAARVLRDLVRNQRLG